MGAVQFGYKKVRLQFLGRFSHKFSSQFGYNLATLDNSVKTNSFTNNSVISSGFLKFFLG